MHIELTSNEIEWAKIIIPVVLTLAHATLLKWIDITTQHVNNIDEIKLLIKKALLRFVRIASNLFAICLLILEFTASAPIDRKDVFLIVWAVFVLFSDFIFRTQEIQSRILRLYEMQITQSTEDRKSQP